MAKRSVLSLQKIKKQKFPLIALGCSALVMLGVFLVNLVYPFGANSVVTVDLYQQYTPLLAELRDKLMAGDSLIYSWQSGGGAFWLGNFFNYLSSPFNFLVLLFPHENITEAVALIIFLKCILASYTFALFINKRAINKTALISAFGVLYACCGWFIAYFWNIMWLDAFYLLPLVALGIERLIDTKKSALYIVSLGLTFLTNYYMAYMVCIFSIAYFLYYIFSNYSNIFTKDFKITFKSLKENFFINRGFNFAFSSICVVLLCAFALVPVFITLSSSSATSDAFPGSFEANFNFFDFLVQHFTSVDTTVLFPGSEVLLPNISCGVISVMLLPLFFFTKTISKKEKIISTVLLGFFALGFYVNYFDFIWHGFHYPNSLPYRFSFMYCFVLLLIAFKTISRIKELPVKYIKITACLFVCFLILTQKLGSENFDEASFVINIVFVIVYFCVLLLSSKRIVSEKVMAIILLFLVCSEYTCGNVSKYDIAIQREDYISDYSGFREIKEELDKAEEEFYRMELLKSGPMMSPCFYGYNGIDFFTSMANEQVSKKQSQLGMATNGINSTIYNSQTPIYNAFFSLKYLLNSSVGSAQGLPADYLSLKTCNADFYVYENLYSLPLGFAVDKRIVDVELDEKNPFASQEKLFAYSTGVENVFDYMEITRVEADNLDLDEDSLIENASTECSVKYRGDAFVEVTLKSNVDGAAYVFVNSEDESIGSVEYRDDSSSFTQDTSVYTYIKYVGYMKKGEELTAKIDIPLELDKEEREFIEDTICVYGAVVNKENFEKGYNKLKSSPLVVESYDDTHLSGTVTMPQNSVLYTSIPYDKGWSVVIDGEPADDKIIAIDDFLMGVELDEGEHSIQFTYSTPGLYEGLIISVVTALALIVFLIIKRKKHKNINSSNV